MKQLRYTLLSDGSSDRGLLQVLNWTLRRHLPHVAIQDEWADLRHLRYPPSRLPGKLDAALSLYACDVLFVHRDAETQAREERLREIRDGLAASSKAEFPHIPVIPVRMTEAWLLIDESAIRSAAGNPHGAVGLQMPTIDELESLADPKAILYSLIRAASQLRGRRLRNLRVAKCAANVAGRIRDFGPLLRLGAYRALESDVRAFAAEYMRRN